MNKLCMNVEPIVNKKAFAPRCPNLSTALHTLSTGFARPPSEANAGNRVGFPVIPS